MGTGRPAPADRLLARLRREAPENLRALIPASALPERMRHGQSAREAGAWSWQIELTDGNLLGSQHTMTYTASAPAILFSQYFSDWSVDAGSA